MNATGFLSLAIELGAGQDEARFRSATSRAYYASFHLVRQFLTELGIRLPKSAAAHDKIRWCLEASKESDLLVVAAHLAFLRNKRNEADYNLDQRMIWTTRDAQLHIETAQEVFQILGPMKLGTLSAEVNQRMTHYASNVLKL